MVQLTNDVVEFAVARFAAADGHDPAAATPCGKWSLRQLRNHTVGALGALADVLEGRAVDAERTDPAYNAEVDCADPAAALRALAPRLSAAASDGAVLDRPHALRGMQLPGRMVLNLALTDAAVHAWDVATATGDRVTIPPQVAEPLLGFARAFADGARGTAFGPAVPTDSPDPSDQLVALLGRTP